MPAPTVGRASPNPSFASCFWTGGVSGVQVVQNERVDGRARQRVIATLGRVDQFQEKGHIDALLSSCSRFAQNVAVMDAHKRGPSRRSRRSRSEAPLLQQPAKHNCRRRVRGEHKQRSRCTMRGTGTDEPGNAVTNSISSFLRYCASGWHGQTCLPVRFQRRGRFPTGKLRLPMPSTAAVVRHTQYSRIIVKHGTTRRRPWADACPPLRRGGRSQPVSEWPSR